MNLQLVRSFLKQTFLLGLVLSLTVYAWVRLIFFEVPFSFAEDGTIIFKTILCGWTMMILLKAAWLFLLLVAQKIEAFFGAKIRWNSRALKTAWQFSNEQAKQ